MRRWLLIPLNALALVVILVEDFLWDPLQRGTARLAAFLRLQRLEARIAQLPPYPALGLFVLPTATLFPMKLAALYLTGQGWPITGMSLLVGAKLIGTALVARLFTLCKQRLLSIPWFEKIYAWATDLRARAVGWLQQTFVWQKAKALKARLRQQRGSPWGRLWRRLRRKQSKALHEDNTSENN